MNSLIKLLKRDIVISLDEGINLLGVEVLGDNSIKLKTYRFYSSFDLWYSFVFALFSLFLVRQEVEHKLRDQLVQLMIVDLQKDGLI